MPVSVSRFIAECDYAALQQRRNTVFQNARAAGATVKEAQDLATAHSLSDPAPAPTWASTTASDLLTEAYQESGAAIYDLVIERDRLRDERDGALLDRNGWRDAYYAERKRHDASRHALSVIANARADHVAAGLIYTARKALGRE